MSKQGFAGMRILVVEDEYFLVDDLRQTLMEAGAETVRLSGEISDAIREIVCDGFSFALIDLNLRGAIAFPLADMLVQSGLPFGFVTGYAKGGLPPRFAQLPCWEKPIDPRSIVADIERLRMNGTHGLLMPHEGSS